MDLLAAIQAIPGLGPLIPYVTLIMAIASVLATVAKPEWGPVYRLINALAVNVGEARNANDPKA